MLPSSIVPEATENCVRTVAPAGILTSGKHTQHNWLEQPTFIGRLRSASFVGRTKWQQLKAFSLGIDIIAEREARQWIVQRGVEI